MKTLASSLLAVLLLTAAAIAQPQISYIIPDIGAAGMNTYVEFIAPTGANGSFGPVGLFSNDPAGADIRIAPANPADSARIVVGPIVVSWGGRLASTQVFVKPGASNGVVTLRLTTAAGSATADFEIVTPQTLGVAGVLSGGGALGSGGQFGRRSKRGAMIVDKLIFNGGSYTVDLSDPDASTPGNQGHLPMIIISRGTVALTSGASLSANGGSPNGGPGGGGGGGAYCDAVLFFGSAGNGTNGGDGYTGGGAGGHNESGNNSRQSIGSGSGAAGATLNGTGPGRAADCSSYESAGGGTGHPFGASGAGACIPTPQEYGGGSAADQKTGGGGGGYGANGANGTGSNSKANAGLAHGNAQGVPVAGGSGGASGNPQQSPPKCSGEGGGGGGALVVYSHSIFNNSALPIQAKGGSGNGGSGTTCGGGAGSGGYIAIGSKVPTGTGGVIDVTGGVANNSGGNGGNGRARYDGYTLSTPTANGAASTYIGPTMDTMPATVQTRTLTVSGTKGPDNITVWVRPEGGTWAQLPAPTVTGRTWTLQYTAPRSGYYCFVAMQTVSSPSTANYLNEPPFVMSQTAANIVRVDLIPLINVDRTDITVRDVNCNETVLDSVKIWNSGDDTLRVGATFKSGVDFQVVSPAGAFKIAPRPGDTVQWLVFRFRPASAGGKVDTLILANNDPRPGKNPTRVIVRGRKANIAPALDKTVLDFGDVCKDSLSSVLTARMANNGDAGITIKSITRLGTGPAVFAITTPLPASLPLAIAPAANAPISATFRPTAAGAFADSFRIVTGPCDSPFVLVMRGRGAGVSVSFNPNPVDFGNVQVNVAAQVPLTITNTGNVSFTIASVFFSGTSFSATGTTGFVGTTVAAGANATGNVQVTVNKNGAFTGRLCFVLNGLCPDTVCVDLQGAGTSSLLILPSNTLAFEADSCVSAPGLQTKTFTLYNRGTAPVSIDTVANTNGAVSVKSSPALPKNLAAGDSVVFTVTWTPNGTGTDKITITTGSLDPTQRSLVVDVTLRNEISKVEALATGGGQLPALIDLGTVLDCSGSATYNLIIRNGGTLSESLTGGFVGGTAFSVSPGAPLAVPRGADQAVTITFSTTVSGTYNDTLVLRSANCNTEIRIPVTALRTGLSYTPAGIAFGNANVGVARSGTATLTNTSTTPNNVKLRVKDVTIVPAAGTPFSIVPPVTLPTLLAPSEVMTVNVSFTPTAQVPYNAQICWHIDSPCDTTICAPLTGAGVQSSVLVRTGSLNFGTQYICQDDSLAFWIINSSVTLPLSVDSMRIVGADASAFVLVRPTAWPIAVTVQDSIESLVRFVPALASGDGLRQATLEIYTSDPAQPIVRVNLIGERRHQSLATPTQLQFGLVEVGTSTTQTLTLENRTAVPMRITQLRLPAPFTIDSPALPVVIGPFDSVKVVVRFTPTDTNAVAATLTAVQDAPCPDSTLIPLDGRGKVTPVGLAEIEIQNTLSGKPGMRVAIPLILRRAQALSASGATTFRATLRFNKTLLLPIGVRAKGQALARSTAASGTLLSWPVDGNDRLALIEIKNDPVPDAAPDTLGFLDVEVMLGDTTVTPITVDTIYWTDGQVNASATSGLFTLDGYCTVGGNRLLKIGTGFGIKTVAPNPFNPSTEIIFETVEAGPSSLVIHDNLGRVVATLIDRESLAPQAYARTWDARAFPSGVYFVVLTTPHARSIYELVLAK